MRYYYGGPDGWSWYPFFGLLMMVVFIGLVLLLAFLFFRRPIREYGLRGRQTPEAAATNASVILDERLARGEISVEQYNELKDAMKKRQNE